MDFIKRFTTWQGILKPEQIKGDMPSNKEIYQRTFQMAWPSALENVLIALIGAIDMIMVGSLGKEAISAVGICNQPKFLCLSPILALNIAVVVLVARRKGANLRKDAIDYTKISLIFSCIISIVVCLISFKYSKEILVYAGAQIDYIDIANSYFRIVVLSLIPYSIGLTMTSAQRGAGFTKISLITNLGANLINIIFNYLLINGAMGFPKLGVIGAALATALGNIVSLIIAFSSLIGKNKYLRIDLNRINDFRIKVLDIFKVACNAFVEQLFLRFGFFIYAKVVAGLGTAEFAAHQICMNIMTISFGFGDGLQVANTSLVGQSLGAKRSDLALVQTRITQLIGFMIAFVLLLAIFIINQDIISLFSNDQVVIQLAFIPLIILGITVMLQIPQVIIVGCLRGAGDVKFVAWMMFLCVGIIRPFISYFLAFPLGLGLIGAWIGLFLDQFMRFMISLLRFKSNKWLAIEV